MEQTLHSGEIMDELITMQEAADLLDVSYNLFKAHRVKIGIPSHNQKTGKKVYFKKSIILNFKENQDVKAAFSNIMYYSRYGRWKNDWRPLDYRDPNDLPESHIPNKIHHLFLRGKFDPESIRSKREKQIEKSRENPPKRVVIELSKIYGFDIDD